MNDLAKFKVLGCSVEGCEASSGGGCQEGYEHFTECPSAQYEVRQQRHDESYIEVDQGLGMSMEGVATVLQNREVATVGILGLEASGKTTFVAMLFHRFFMTASGFNGHLFKDSETFLGLNSKLHYADIKSKRTAVQMPRTSLEEEPVFHLKTCKGGVDSECLLIDIPGETMRHRLSRDKEAWTENRGLARATHVLAFVDLEVLQRREDRGRHVECLLDALAYSVQSKTWKGKKLMVVFSKADKFMTGLDVYVERVKEKVVSRFKEEYGEITFCALHSLGNNADAEKSLGEVLEWIYI